MNNADDVTIESTEVTEETIPETTPIDISFTEATEADEADNQIKFVELSEVKEEIAETEPLETPSEAVEAPETEETEIEIDEHDVELLACVIYQEAGSDSICDDCRRRVADVVLNRVEDDRFPDTIEKVLTKKGQYGRYYYTGVVWPKRASYAVEANAVERARRIAREVLEGEHSEIYGEGYVWQATFKQGKSGFWCCGTYFGRS